jgi:class 3 adenylate cyclase
MPGRDKERRRGEGPAAQRDQEPERGEISSEATVAADSAPAPHAPSPSGDRLPPGSSFGEYQIIEPIGRGGMGVVYRCRHRTLDRPAALKILNVRAQGGGSVGEARFLREARSAAQLDHHNVVTIYNAGQHQGSLFIEMQLVDGEPLSAIAANGPLDPQLATRYVEQIAHALQHAHERGVVHRDIKPDNVLVTADGLVKVTDFGLAKQSLIDTALTAPGSIMGTPIYMAPEQWQSEPTDARTDLYSLGVTCYQLLVGAPPYAGKLGDLLRLHTQGKVPLAHEANPVVPPALSAVAARLMAKRPEDRYQRAADLIVELRRIQTRSAELAAPPAEPPRPPPPAAPRAVAEAPAARAPVPATSRGWLAVLGLALVAAAAALGLDALGSVRGLELRLLDRRLATRPTSHSARLALVVIDEETTRVHGNPPGRRAIASLIERLEAAGARAIVIDLLIAESDPGLEQGALLDASEAARRLIHAFNLEPGRAREGEAGGPLLERFALPRLDGGQLEELPRAQLPFAKLLARTPGLGHVAIAVDPDGVVRRIPLLARHGGRVYPSLSLAAVLLAEGASRGEVERTPRGLRVTAAGRPALEVPLDARGMLRLGVRGDPRASFPRHSLAQLLARPADAAGRKGLAADFGGRVVLLGAWFAGQADLQPMPGLAAAPLVLAHAVAVEGMLARDHLRVVGPAALAGLVLALALLGAAAGRLLPLPYPLVAAPLLLGGFFLLGDALVSSSAQLALPTLAPLLAAVAALVGGGVLRAASERRALRQVSDALGRYLPRRVAQRILSDGSALRLGGKRKELTVLYAELHDFAALTDRLEPEEVGELLERFFAVTGETIAHHGGSLDRFDGDGVRAYFGDPVPQPDHATRAVRCALELREALHRVIEGWSSDGRPRPGLGVGVTTGYVTVGNIGTLQRMEYTVLGRHVEQAEELARRAQGGILVSGRTRSLATELAFRPRGEAFEPE